MNWYSGNIGDAIAESKSSKLIFLVYCFGTFQRLGSCQPYSLSLSLSLIAPANIDANDASSDEVWSSEQVSDMCRRHCVSLKLQSDTEVCSQFKQICE